MRKSMLSLILVIMLIAGILVGCGGNTSSDTGESSSSGTSNESSGSSNDNSASGAGGEQLKVVLIGNQQFGDNGPMDDMAAAGEQAASDFGILFKKIVSEPASFEEDIRSMCQEGYDMVMTTFPYMTDATVAIAEEFPDVKFVAIFQEVNEKGRVVPNIWDAVFRGQTTFYVSGYMAGLATQTNSIGFIVGSEQPGPNAEGNGFMRGVRDANPDAFVEFGIAHMRTARE